MDDSSFLRWGGWATIGVGICSLLYGVAFVAQVALAPKMAPVTALTSFGVQSMNALLALGGLLGLVAVVAIFQYVKGVSEGWARLALWLGMLGSLLRLLHGWLDLVNNPVLAQAFGSTSTAGAAALYTTLPSLVDPRGLGTFGLSALSLLIFAGLLYQTQGIPRRLVLLAQVSTLLLGLIFIGTALYANGDGLAAARYLFLIPGPLQAILIAPWFNLWLGNILRRDGKTTERIASAVQYGDPRISSGK